MVDSLSLSEEEEYEYYMLLEKEAEQQKLGSSMASSEGRPSIPELSREARRAIQSSPDPERSYFNRSMDQLFSPQAWGEAAAKVYSGLKGLVDQYALNTDDYGLAGGFAKTAYDVGKGIANAPVEDQARMAAQTAPLFLPGVGIPLKVAMSAGAGPLTDILTGQEPEEIVSNIQEDAIFAGPATLAAKGTNIAKRGYNTALKVRDKVARSTPKLIKEFLADRKRGSLVAELGYIRKNKTDAPITKDLIAAERTLVDEDLARGIKPDKMNPDAALDAVSKRYREKLNTYTQKEQSLLETTDVLAERYGSPKIRVNELLDDNIRSSPYLSEYIDEIKFENFDQDLKVAKTEFTATEAKQLLKKVQADLREAKMFDAGVRNGNITIANPSKDMPRIQKELGNAIEGLNKLQKDLRSRIDDHIENIWDQAYNDEIVEGLPEMSFKEINRRRHDLLYFDDVFSRTDSTGKVTPGGFEVDNLERMNIQKRRALQDPELDVRIAGAQGGPLRTYLTKPVGELLSGQTPESRLLGDVVGAGDELVGSMNRIADSRAATELPNPYQVEPFADPMYEAAVAGGMITPDVGQSLAPPPPEVPLPRDLAVVMSNPQYLDRLRDAVGIDGIAILKDSLNRGPFAQQQAFYSLIQQAPDLFEDNLTEYRSEVRVGNGYVLTDPNEAKLAVQELGSILDRPDSTDAEKLWAGRQISAFKNPRDMRIFLKPEQEKQFKELANKAKEEPSSALEALRRSAPTRVSTPAGEKRAGPGEGSSSLGKP